MVCKCVGQTEKKRNERKMKLLSDKNEIVNAEFSFSSFGGVFSIVVESSGGGTATRERRNPEYNKLVSIILSRLQKLDVKIVGVYLESKKYQSLTYDQRRIELSHSVPLRLGHIDVDELRKEIGRGLAKKLQADGVASNGNAQKRFRLDLSRSIRQDEIISSILHKSQAVEDKILQSTAQETDGLALVKARIGQGKFRDSLLKKFGVECVVTGINQEAFLVASHIKPWAVSTNDERLDANNGLLLFCSHDRAFDLGFMSFSKSGEPIFSKDLTQSVRDELTRKMSSRPNVSKASEIYMDYHRDFVFRK